MSARDGALAIESGLLTELRAATADPFADPVLLRGVSITRAEARAMERGLWWGREGRKAHPCREARDSRHPLPPAGGEH